MAAATLSAQEVICIKNEGYAASLEPRKSYSVMPDEAAATLGLLRIVDESEEDYLYPANFFIPIELSPAIREALHLTSD